MASVSIPPSPRIPDSPDAVRDASVGAPADHPSADPPAPSPARGIAFTPAAAGAAGSPVPPPAPTATPAAPASWLARGAATLAVLILGALGLIGVLRGVPSFLQEGYTQDTLVMYLGGSMAIVLLAIAAHSGPAGRVRGLGPATAAGAATITAVALVLAAMAGRLAYERTIGQSATDILFLLGASLLLLLTVALAGRTPRPSREAARRALAALRALPTPWLLGGIAVLGLAIATRLLLLGRFPIVNHSDEMMYAVYARSFRDGISVNPFRVHEGLLHIELWNWLVGQISRPFPADALWSYRVASALLGILSVVATFLLGRRVLDPVTGLVGAFILAVMPLHIWASRNALDNITDAVVLPLALWLADRAMATRDRRDAIACGIVMGLGLYGYFGGRIIPLAIAITMMGLLVHRPLLRSLRDLVRLGLWTLAGFLAAAAPGLGYFRSEPHTFFGRVQSVTDTVSGRNPSLEDRLQRALEGLAYPLTEPTGIFFRAVTPKVSVLGSIGGLFFGIGVCLWLVAIVLRVVRRQPAWLTARPGGMLVGWLLFAVPVSQSEGMESQRFLGATPVWALAIATGIVLTARGLAALMHQHDRWVVRLATAGLLVAIAAQNLSWYVSDDREGTSWGGEESSRFYDLGWRLASAPEETKILGVSWPEIMYDRVGGLQFFAPGREPYVRYLPPFSATEPPFGAPRLADGQLLVLGPSQRDTICAVTNANPHASLGAAYDRYGTLLYLVATNGEAFPLRTDETPAGSTFATLPPPACP